MEDYIQKLDNFIFDENAYKKYLDKWLNGIKSEMLFWRHYIETKGNEWKTDWNDLISNDRKFFLEKYLNLEETKFLDVGSGPFSSCGMKTDKTHLDFMAVDPLAYIYKELKQKNGITTGITPEYSMVERLNEKFERNSLNIVHMRNSLDHAFNPIVGIFQMLSICKVGGKVILQHARNEAENENYEGFHQWNLCVMDNSFIVWRPGIKYNISKILDKYADIDIEDIPNEHWFTVILTKKMDVPELEVYKKIVHIIDEKVFRKLSELIVLDAYQKGKMGIIVLKGMVKKIPFFGNIMRIIYRQYKKQKNGT